MTLIASIITFSKKKKNGKKILPSTLDKKIDSLEPQSKTIGVDSLRNYNSHKYSTNGPFNGAFALKSTLQLVIILAKTAISPIFLNFCRNRSFCWTPLYLDLINFSKNCNFSNFLQFLEKSQKLQRSQYLLDTLLPPVTLDLINFSKNGDFSNFWRNCRNRSFCWTPLYLL